MLQVSAHFQQGPTEPIEYLLLGTKDPARIEEAPEVHVSESFNPDTAYPPIPIKDILQATFTLEVTNFSRGPEYWLEIVYTDRPVPSIVKIESTTNWFPLYTLYLYISSKINYLEEEAGTTQPLLDAEYLLLNPPIPINKITGIHYTMDTCDRPDNRFRIMYETGQGCYVDYEEVILTEPRPLLDLFHELVRRRSAA